MWTSSHKLTLSTYTKVNSHFHFLRSSSFKSPADKLLFKLLHPYLWSLCRAEHELALPCVHFAQSQAAGFSVLLQLLLLPLLQIPVRGWVMICTGVVAVAVALRDRRGKISAHSDYCEQHLPDRWNNLNIWLRGVADKRSDLSWRCSFLLLSYLLGLNSWKGRPRDFNHFLLQWLSEVEFCELSAKPTRNEISSKACNKVASKPQHKVTVSLKDTTADPELL